MDKIVVDPSKQIGKGVTASVYLLDEDHIVKIFRDVVPADDIRYEYDCAKTFEKAGIPTPAAVAIVQSDQGTGIIYERIRGVTLSDEMQQHKDRLYEYGQRYGALVKLLHEQTLPDAGIVRAKDAYKEHFRNCEGFMTEAEKDEVFRYLDRIPDTDNLLHGDIAPVNIMVQNDELFVIDVPTMKVGHPVFDLLQPYTFCRVTTGFCEKYRAMSDAEKAGPVGKFLSRFESRYLDRTQSEEVWNGFLKGYFKRDPDAEKTRVEYTLHFYNCIKFMASVTMRGKFDDEAVRFLVDYGRTWLAENKDKTDLMDFSLFSQET